MGCLHSYNIGLGIVNDKDSIFKTELKWGWGRERKFDNYGLCDLYFEANDKKIVLELKLKNTSHSYLADIKKLTNLNDEYAKYFCILIDSINSDYDDRMGIIEAVPNIKKIKSISFDAKFKNQKSPQYCILALYSIL